MTRSQSAVNKQSESNNSVGAEILLTMTLSFTEILISIHQSVVLDIPPVISLVTEICCNVAWKTNISKSHHVFLLHTLHLLLKYIDIY